jgi:predicted SprT family Zn-dependent metalloprotease
MLSRDCDGCGQKTLCNKRFITVRKGEFVYCKDGSKHLVDINQEWIKN